MLDGVLNSPVFRLHLIMFCVIITKIKRIFRIPKQLEDNLPSFELTASLGKAKRGRDSSPSKGTTTIFSFGYPSCIRPCSGPFCWQNPCCGSNSEIDLVVVLEYTLFQLCSNTEQISQVHKIQKKLCKPPCCRSNQPLSKFNYFSA